MKHAGYALIFGTGREVILLSRTHQALAPVRDENNFQAKSEPYYIEPVYLLDEGKKVTTFFPMQNGPSIPWRLAEIIYAAYAARYGRQQSMERLAERGGFGWAEVAEFWKDSLMRHVIEEEERKWRVA